MKREKRHIRILELLDQRERLEVDELAETFDVSVETIRRDLTTLSEQGMLRKVHGGAVRFQTAQERTFSLRTEVNRAAKVSISAYMLRFIDPGDSLFINAGTTTAIFAEQAAHALDDLTVITNCATVAHTMWGGGETGHKVFLLGGAYSGIDTETSGPLLHHQLRMFQADHAVLTIGALSAANGPMEYRVEAAEIVRIMMEQAHKRTLLIDYSKLERTALVRIGDLTAMHRVITDRLPPEPMQAALDEAGVELHVTGLVGLSSA